MTMPERIKLFETVSGRIEWGGVYNLGGIEYVRADVARSKTIDTANRLNADVQHWKSRVDELRTQLDTANARIAELEANAAEYGRSLADMHKTAIHYEDANATANARIAGLETALREYAQCISENNQLTERIAELEAVLREIGRRIDNLDDDADPDEVDNTLGGIYHKAKSILSPLPDA